MRIQNTVIQNLELCKFKNLNIIKIVKTYTYNTQNKCNYSNFNLYNIIFKVHIVVNIFDTIFKCRYYE